MSADSQVMRGPRAAPTTPAIPVHATESALSAVSTEIEPARMSDWMDILQMVARFFPHADELELRYHLCNQSGCFHAARVGHQLAGFMHIEPKPEIHLMWLNMIAVDEPFRRLGIGLKFMALAEQLARQAGLNRIGLRVLAENHQAIELYRRQGYAKVKETREGPAGLPFLVMEKQLTGTAQGQAGSSARAADPGWRRWINRLYYLTNIGARSPLRGRPTP